ncbi:MAG: glycosyltransferase [Butyricicoccaceae bacterium]
MKVLLLTVTAGYGHHATANALAELLRQRGAECEVIDIYEVISKIIRTTIAKGYLLSSEYTPALYRLFYTLTENRKNPQELQYSRKNIVTLVNTFGAFRFEKVTDLFDPDVIVCTHVLAAQMVGEMKKRNMVHAPCIGILTDYCLHPYWEDVQNMEYLITPTGLITHTIVKRGISESIIRPLGIPIHPKFNQQISQEEARRQLGLRVDQPTILVMSGSMGYGNPKKIVEQIEQTGIGFQILAVCGNNKKAYKRLSAYQPSAESGCILHTMGFVDNVQVLMSAADCLVTKPGGLTVSEALAKGLPMILVNPIPGQEERNTEFLVNNGIASLVTKTYPLDDALYHLFHDPMRLQTVHQMIRAIGHPDASERLADFLLTLVSPGQISADTDFGAECDVLVQ